MSDADDDNNINPANPAQGQQQQAQPPVQPDAQQQQQQGVQPQQGLQLHPVVHQQQAPPLQPPQQHFTLMIIGHTPAAAGGAPGAPPAPVANPFAAAPVGAGAGVPLGAQPRPRPPPGAAAAPVRPFRPPVIPMQLHINAAGPPPGPPPHPLQVPAGEQAQANVPNLVQPVGGFGGVRPAAPAAGPPLPQQNPNPFQGLNAALAQVLPHVGLPGVGGGNINRVGAAGGGGGGGGGWRLVSVDATVSTTTVPAQDQNQAQDGILSPQGNMHPLPPLGAGMGMGPPLLGELPPAFVTEGGGAAAAAPAVTGDITVTNHYKKSYYYNMGDSGLDGDDGPPMPTVMQSGVDSTPNTDSPLPPPNLNEARRRLGDAYRLLYTIARIKDKAREQKVSFIKAAPGNGVEWVEGNIVNAEILIKRFEKGETEIDALVREMARKVVEALRGVREGEREGQQSGGGGEGGETSGGGGSGTGEGGLTLEEQRSSTRS